MKKSKTILAFSDIHEPFSHRDFFKFITYVKKVYSPDEVVCLGDEIDSHALSQFVKDPDGMGAGIEFKQALKNLSRYFKLFPNLKLCESNHTVRYKKKAFNAGIPEAFIKDVKEALGAPKGWEWAYEWNIDGIRFEHGEAFGGKHPAMLHSMSNMCSTVVGHHHARAGVSYFANKDKIIFGASVGCGLDRKMYAFKYSKHQKAKPILGCLVIVNKIPAFIPMAMNNKGRWIGKA